jgi:hypothetical protein
MHPQQSPQDGGSRFPLAIVGISCRFPGGVEDVESFWSLAHRADQWAEFCTHDHLLSLLQAYVTYIGGDGACYSCGMHNLGHPDAVVEADISPKDAAHRLHTFVGYLLVENPRLKNRETFSVAADAPRYRLFHGPCTLYPAGELFHNPFGMWKLVPA